MIKRGYDEITNGQEIKYQQPPPIPNRDFAFAIVKIVDKFMNRGGHGVRP
jgi:hypothetical protein